MDKKLFKYTMPGVLDGHNYNDDVAITYADNIDEAIQKFAPLYRNASKENVSECFWNNYGVSILTDY